MARRTGTGWVFHQDDPGGHWEMHDLEWAFRAEYCEDCCRWKAAALRKSTGGYLEAWIDSGANEPEAAMAQAARLADEFDLRKRK